MDEKRFAEFLKGLEEAVEWQKGNIRAHTNYGYKTRQECDELIKLEEEKEKVSAFVDAFDWIKSFLFSFVLGMLK